MKKPVKREPKTKAEISLQTALKCPCGHRDVAQNVIHGELRSMCRWCGNTKGFTE